MVRTGFGRRLQKECERFLLDNRKRMTVHFQDDIIYIKEVEKVYRIL